MPAILRQQPRVLYGAGCCNPEQWPEEVWYEDVRTVREAGIVMVPGAASASGVFFLRQFLLGLPREVEEAALVNRMNRFRVFSRIVLLLSKPALITLAFLSFLTLPLELAILEYSYATDYPVIMAGGMIVIVLVVFRIKG
ncbi:MAG: ABC transporter, permease protein 2 (cluster 1, maltose/g3p/polyamine/iron) [uncultured Rubrobacteraceae bacterium]|uniref:ABC transporter, permease protein 2 (Cluster 1, maltose/g3p/polyamine/iron) n=1 Tax=uncultured Rubrobacteraceae bacterium TaxID=349277 RepID=A0A6J4QC54_9ACTN|nr:MAG: ABC transporter, permease protein 2 (cluster 1, maltose/g3p/polyamine/iron) [uncultured Rubrobacteraceae bacterium]